MPLVGLFTIKFNGYRIWEIKKIPTNQPMPVNYGRVRGNKSIFKVVFLKFHLDWYHTDGSQKLSRALSDYPLPLSSHVMQFSVKIHLPKSGIPSSHHTKEYSLL